MNVAAVMVVVASVAAEGPPVVGSPLPRTLPPAVETPARFDGTPYSGVRFGVRSGFAMPAGPAYTSSGALRGAIAGQIPMRLDIGYRAEHVYLGLRGQLGLIVPNDCAADEQCSGTDVRVGVLAAYHFAPVDVVDPWFGLGVGYEILALERSVDGRDVGLSAQGPELATIDLGLDWRVTQSLRVGPVLTGALGRFDRVSLGGVSTRDFSARFHGWVGLEFHASFEP